jgi:predicted Zn finger-like uncharacterized protein
MRVVCDSCGASYKIPDSKLTKEVNKATCRKCGHAIFIRRAGEEDPKPVSAAPAQQNEERTLITSAADLERHLRSLPQELDGRHKVDMLLTFLREGGRAFVSNPASVEFELPPLKRMRQGWRAPGAACAAAAA